MPHTLHKPCLVLRQHNNANGYPSALLLLRQTLPASMPCTSCNCSQQQEQHPEQGTMPGMLCRKPSTIMVCHPSVHCVVQRAAPMFSGDHADRLTQTHSAFIARAHGHAIRSNAHQRRISAYKTRPHVRRFQPQASARLCVTPPSPAKAHRTGSTSRVGSFRPLVAAPLVATSRAHAPCRGAHQ